MISIDAIEEVMTSLVNFVDFSLIKGLNTLKTCDADYTLQAKDKLILLQAACIVSWISKAPLILSFDLTTKGGGGAVYENLTYIPLEFPTSVNHSIYLYACYAEATNNWKISDLTKISVKGMKSPLYEDV